MENKKFYVYVYLDPRKYGVFNYGDYSFTNEPIYIGKGVRNRINQHLSTVNEGKTSLFYNKLRKILKEGFEPIKFKVIENLTEEESLLFEKKLIGLIGRIDIETGSLCNMTEGGEVGFKRTEESKKKLSESKRGEKNPMFGKTTSQKQKDAVNEARKLGKIKLTESGRNRIIESSRKRKGKKNNVIRCDTKIYFLRSPNSEEFEILGAKRLQLFCKENKLQYHTLKNHIDVIITEKHVKGNRINAKNTIGWKVTIIN